jgi:hypothetical protein
MKLVEAVTFPTYILEVPVEISTGTTIIMVDVFVVFLSPSVRILDAP